MQCTVTEESCGCVWQCETPTKDMSPFKCVWVCSFDTESRMSVMKSWEVEIEESTHVEVNRLTAPLGAEGL